MRLLNTPGIALAAAGFLSWAAAGWAQSDAPPADDLPPVLEEITVTAQKREENVQTVPIAVTALSAEQIEDSRLRSVEDFIALIPNVTVARSFTVGNSLVTIRGISQVNNSDPPLVVVVDGVPQGNQKQLVQELFDIERLELLKGPQGALYGRGALGGVLNIITRSPDKELEGFLRGGVGNGDSVAATAALGGKLAGDKLLFRLASSFRDSEGTRDNVFLHRPADPWRDLSTRLQLEWLPLETLRLDLRGASSSTRGGAVAYSIFPTSGFANDFRFDPDENILGKSERESRDYSLRAVWENRAGTLTAIGGASDLTEAYLADGDFSNPSRGLAFPLGQLGQGQDLDVELVSQELRWESRDDGPWRWGAGAYLLTTERRLLTRLFLDTDGTTAGFLPVLAFAESNDNTAWSTFGEASWHPAGRFSVSGALRYDEDRRQQTDLATREKRRRTFSAWQPRLTASFAPTDRTLCYASFGTGFRSGGFNAPTARPQVFAKETSRNLEAGFKSTLWRGRLRVQTALYETRVEDSQIFLVDITRGGQIIDNLKRAEIRGLETDLVARLAKWLDLFLSTGVNDAEIKDFDGSGRFRGNQTPGNLRAKVNAGLQLTRGIAGDRLLAVGRLDAELRDKQYWHADNLDVQGPVQLVNLWIGVESSRWKLAAWAKNLTNERYYVEYLDDSWAGGTLSGNDIGQLGPPRAWGLEITHRF